MPICGLDCWLRPSVTLWGRGEATDVAVAQAVIDEGEKFAGRGHFGDVAAPPLGDAPVGVFEVAAGVVLLAASTAAQRNRRDPCLEIEPRCTLSVGLAMLRSQARPGAQAVGSGSG